MGLTLCRETIDPQGSKIHCTVNFTGLWASGMTPLGVPPASMSVTGIDLLKTLLHANKNNRNTLKRYVLNKYETFVCAL